MLFDQFDEFINGDHKTRFRLPEEMSAIKKIGSRLKQINRYILERDAVHMVQNVTIMSPARFLTAMALCRLPQKEMWVEFEFAHRSSWLKNAIVTRGIVPISNDHEAAPSRLGFYIKQIDDHGFKMLVQPFWTHKAPVVDIALKCLIIDTSPDFKYNEKIVDARVDEMTNLPEGFKWDGKTVVDETYFQAVARLEQRVKYDIPDYIRPVWEIAASMGNNELLDSMMDMSNYDLASEWRFAIALLTLMNSRNIINVSDSISYEALNKQRIKKGKPPLLTHRNITLHLTKVQRNRMTHAGMTKREMEAQLVSGHFKLRKTGIFWWTPHMRGGSMGEIYKGKTIHVRE